MLIKPKFNWGEGRERTICEIVSQDGPMKTREILYVIEQLCIILEEQETRSVIKAENQVHPTNISINADGNVKFLRKKIPISVMDAYIAPEKIKSVESLYSTSIYALGMLMLFMVTGAEKKIDLETSVANRKIRSIIEKSIAFDPRERFQNINELQEAVNGKKRFQKSGGLILSAFFLICIFVYLLFNIIEMGRARGSILGRDSGYDQGYAIGYERGFSDAPGVEIEAPSIEFGKGNLSGNLILEKGAFAVCSEDEVFFLSDGSIYKMDPYKKKIELLLEDGGIYGLNYYEGWIYYSTDEKVFRLDPVKGKVEDFCDSRTGLLYIVKGKYYLYDKMDTYYLYKIDPHSKILTQLSGSMNCSCLNILEDKLYYIDLNKGKSIYQSDLDGGNINLINSNPFDSFCIYEDKIYASTSEREFGGQSAGILISMDLRGGDVETLTTIPAFYPNVSGGGIFYVAGKNRSLEWMSLDGRTCYTIVPQGVGEFNIADRWIFYMNEEDGNLWRVRIDGSDAGKIID